MKAVDARDGAVCIRVSQLPREACAITPGVISRFLFLSFPTLLFLHLPPNSDLTPRVHGTPSPIILVYRREQEEDTHDLLEPEKIELMFEPEKLSFQALLVHSAHNVSKATMQHECLRAKFPLQGDAKIAVRKKGDSHGCSRNCT